MAETIHHHDEQLEGPLPPGFPSIGNEGKVRNIYVAGEQVCLIASDRVSAFDQVSPTLIPGKGLLLNDIAGRELQAAEAAGIETWLQELPINNARASVGVRTDVLPIEAVFRNYMTGTMWRVYEGTGDFANFGLPGDWHEWQDFTAEPMFTPSTKADKDEYFNPAHVEQVTGVDQDTLNRMEEIGRALFALGTKRAAERGLVLVDTKYEMGFAADGRLLVIDEVHTPDSSRFVLADGFAEAIAKGEQPRGLSKEFLRGMVLARANNNQARAAEIMRFPLPEDTVKKILSRYQELHRLFTGG